MNRLFVPLAFLLLLLPGPVLLAQKVKKAGALPAASIARLHAAEDTLALLAYAIVNDSIEQDRFAACKVLITKLVQTLKVENSFNYPFPRMKSISILAPPDSSFRIFSWQLFVNDSTYRYYGAIQMNQQDLKLFPIIDRSVDIEDQPAYEVLTPEKWYGALYYNLRQFDTKEGHKYLLFGYDAYRFFLKRKVIDVLSFDKEGKPVFGATVFDKSTTAKGPAGPPVQRMVFEYSADAAIRVNWDEQYKMILFDHLVPIPSPYRDEMVNVADGSYDGLKLEKGRWHYVDKVFNDVQDEAPRPEPVLDDRKDKDIVGKPKKQPGKKQ